MKVKLKIIPKPAKGTRTVMKLKFGPVFKGDGKSDYICGQCGAVIAEKVHRGQIENIVVQCPKCEEYNEFP